MTLEEFKKTQWMTEEEYNDYADALTKEQIKKTINDVLNDVLKDYDNKLQERINKAIGHINICGKELSKSETEYLLKILKGEE